MILSDVVVAEPEINPLTVHMMMNKAYGVYIDGSFYEATVIIIIFVFVL